MLYELKIRALPKTRETQFEFFFPDFNYTYYDNVRWEELDATTPRFYGRLIHQYIERITSRHLNWLRSSN